jgi:hypothetical protein
MCRNTQHEGNGRTTKGSSAYTRIARPVQDRCELPGLDETGEGEQLLPLLLVRDQPEPLPDKAVGHERPQDASDGPEHVAGCAAAVKHEGPRRGQCPAQPAQRPVAHVVEDYVVTRASGLARSGGDHREGRRGRR